MIARRRRAGSLWRLLVHEPGGVSHHVTSDPTAPARRDEQNKRLGLDPALSTVTVLPDTEFDEVVIGRWCHLEQMDTDYWWGCIGGVTVHVRADRDGHPTHVTVHGPGDWDDPVPGCTYDLVWSAR